MHFLEPILFTMYTSIWKSQDYEITSIFRYTILVICATPGKCKFNFEVY